MADNTLTRVDRTRYLVQAASYANRRKSRECLGLIQLGELLSSRPPAGTRRSLRGSHGAVARTISNFGAMAGD